MAHRATVANGYRWRLIIIAVVCLGYSGWCVYDGAYMLPEKQDKRAVFEQFVADNGPDPALWAAEARRLGWAIEEPKEIGENDILTQWLQLAIVLPIGLYNLYLFLMWSRRFVEGDASGVRANGGRAFTWDQVAAVDAHKWDRKGIAYIEFESGSGQQMLVLDDWKMEREPTDAIFELLRGNVPEEKVSGLNASSDSADGDGSAEGDGPAESAEPDEVREPVDA